MIGLSLKKFNALMQSISTWYHLFAPAADLFLGVCSSREDAEVVVIALN